MRLYYICIQNLDVLANLGTDPRFGVTVIGAGTMVIKT